jgi:DNA-binding response OmpR family regulator
MRKKILLVEDDSSLLELLRIHLEDAGFSISTAQNGVEALEKARATAPDTVVLDLVLPELDGFEVCEALRNDATTATKPIIVVTGLNSEMTRYAGLESGADEYVTKPVTPAHLVSRIQYWLQQPPRPVRVPREPRAGWPRGMFRPD